MKRCLYKQYEEKKSWEYDFLSFDELWKKRDKEGQDYNQKLKSEEKERIPAFKEKEVGSKLKDKDNEGEKYFGVTRDDSQSGEYGKQGYREKEKDAEMKKKKWKVEGETKQVNIGMRDKAEE